MWMMPLHLHVNQKSDYIYIYIYISVVYFKLWVYVSRPKEKKVLFPVTSPTFLGSVFKKFQNIHQYPIRLQKSLSRPKDIRVRRVTGNKTFLFWSSI